MGSNSCLSVLTGWSDWSDLNGQQGAPPGSVQIKCKYSAGEVTSLPGVERIRSLSENLTDFSVAVEEDMMELTLSLLYAGLATLSLPGL